MKKKNSYTLFVYISNVVISKNIWKKLCNSVKKKTKKNPKIAYPSILAECMEVKKKQIFTNETRLLYFLKWKWIFLFIFF